MADDDRDDDEMRRDYDCRGGVPGKYAERYAREFDVDIQPEANGFVSRCPDLDIASQGETPEEAEANLEEALDLFFEFADESEVRRRLQA